MSGHAVRVGVWAALVWVALAPAWADGSGTPAESKVYFEPSSNRLMAAQEKTFDSVAGALLKRGQTEVLLLVPTTSNEASRRFVMSRVAIVERELDRRGLVAQRLTAPSFARADDFLVLRLPEPPAPLPTAPVVATQLLPDKPSETVKPVAAESQVPAPPEEVWLAVPGNTLRDVLVDWGKRAGWTIVWQSDREYPLEAPAKFSGDFVSAARRLFDGFATAMPAPLGNLYKENQVLVVVSGEEK